MNSIILPKNVIDFMKAFKEAGYLIYVVGGAVRDMLLNKQTTNWDFTTNANPEQIQKLFPNNFYNNDYGTVSVPMPDNLIFEITPFRNEGLYKDNRHPEDVTWTETIDKDLSRRDFTINSIAYDGNSVIDPYNGQKDLQTKIVRAVREPSKRFQEDALRLMRGVRIATELQFEIEAITKKAIIENAELLKNVSRERIRDELFKILKSDFPSEGILLLKDTGLLNFIIPELSKAFETPQVSPKRHHIYDVGTHCVMSLKECKSKNHIVRLACLLHDIGKPATFNKDENTQIITFYNHEIIGAKIVKDIAQNLRLSKKDSEKLYQLVRYHQFTVSELQTDKALRRFIREVGKEHLEDMLMLREADRIGSGSTPTSWRFELFKKRLIEVQKEPFKITDLKIDGTDVMKELNLKPGRKIGEILQQLFEEVVEKKVENDREMLLKKLKEFDTKL
ncbi:MAG TPA: CCA tRNA nucleotidyltransferase [Candidatus Nitrosocosmicus sp.]|nr:CCA tRNA nucleotidyltransferase [Candidatus Nitrosocosmicus sp.]